MRAPPLESRRVADDGPAPRQRRDGIFGERRVGVEQQERVAARRGHGVDEGPAAPASGRRDDRRAVVLRYVRRRIRRAAIRHNYFERRAVARREGSPDARDAPADAARLVPCNYAHREAGEAKRCDGVGRNCPVDCSLDMWGCFAAGDSGVAALSVSD